MFQAMENDFGQKYLIERIVNPEHNPFNPYHKNRIIGILNTDLWYMLRTQIDI